MSTIVFDHDIVQRMVSQWEVQATNFQERLRQKEAEVDAIQEEMARRLAAAEKMRREATADTDAWRGALTKQLAVRDGELAEAIAAAGAAQAEAEGLTLRLRRAELSSRSVSESAAALVAAERKATDAAAKLGAMRVERDALLAERAKAAAQRDAALKADVTSLTASLAAKEAAALREATLKTDVASLTASLAAKCDEVEAAVAEAATLRDAAPSPRSRAKDEKLIASLTTEVARLKISEAGLAEERLEARLKLAEYRVRLSFSRPCSTLALSHSHLSPLILSPPTLLSLSLLTPLRYATSLAAPTGLGRSSAAEAATFT